MKIKNLLLLVFLLIGVNIYSQGLTNWQTFTNQNNIKSFIVGDNAIWAATSGGAFKFDFSTNTYTSYHKSEGLNGINLTSVVQDNHGKIWFGSTEGLIDVFDSSTGSFKTLYEISSSDYNPKAINELRVSGDTIIASTNFGIVLINSINYVIIDTYLRLGVFTSNTSINSVLKSKVIFAATNEGIAKQKEGSINLSVPEAWDNYTLDAVPNKIINYQDSIIAITKNDVVIFRNGIWAEYPGFTNLLDIRDVYAKGDSLFVLNGNTVLLSYNGVVSTVYTPAIQISKLFIGVDAFAGSSEGIVKLNDNSVIAPNGPNANLFPSIVVDDKGILWSASSIDPSGKGFYSYDGNTWTNYNKFTNSGIYSDNYFNVYKANDNTKYFGNWGGGFLRLNDNGMLVFDQNNTGIQGINTDPNYIVIGGFDNDSRNNLWILNYGSATKTPLSMLTTDSLWYHFNVPAENNTYLYGHFNLAVDNNDTKWYIVKDPAKAGLYFFNENKTYDDASDDKSGFVSTNNGLNNNALNTLVVDKRGEIWVGTSLGLNIISNPNTVVNNTTPQFRISSIFSMRQQTINCIAIDPLNQKWIGTDQGLFLINSDGSDLIYSLNSRNSVLPVDEIRSIALDENLGKVYVGTDYGLISFDSPYLKPQESFTELFVYPSPFVLNSTQKQLTIDGLIRETDIKILSITGKLIKEFSSPGGRIAFWDGKDESGNFVSSGVYLIVAFDKEGNNVFTSKVAVIKE
ncbi:MAG TPA: two-component regulator propeller domain-containing protein [Ignavibacteriaceae bacterium]|nr:two-component regulator propeller domain-containing protein [Ignavibacteriaceae bacterium]